MILHVKLGGETLKKKKKDFDANSKLGLIDLLIVSIAGGLLH